MRSQDVVASSSPIAIAVLAGLATEALVPGSAAAATASLPAAQDGLRLAYLDPGSGSFLIQALVATLAGIVVTLRMYWGKVRSFLGLASNEDEAADRAADSAPNDD